MESDSKNADCAKTKQGPSGSSSNAACVLVSADKPHLCRSRGTDGVPARQQAAASGVDRAGASVVAIATSRGLWFG